MTASERRLFEDVLLAFVLSIIAFSIRLLCDPVLGDRQPYVALYPAVAVAAWMGSTRCAILTAMTGYVLADYFFIEPRSSLDIPNATNTIVGVTYVIGCAIIIWLTYRAKSLLAQARQARAEAQSASEALREADAKKDQFLSLLSHELRTPLSSIIAACRVLKTRMGTDPVAQDGVAIQERQLRQLTMLLDELLDVARISRGRIEVVRSRVDIRRSIEDAMEANKPLIESKQQRLHVALPQDEPLYAFADPTRVTQIVTNLLNNSSRYSPNGASIWLRAEGIGDQIIVSVEDTGRGISAEILPIIFTSFHVSPAQDVGEHGLGLGLWLSYRLAELHGGTLSASSEGVGKGAKFELRLPVKEP